MFRPHMHHHQATLIIGETTALYILSSVFLGTYLFLLLISFVGYIHYISLYLFGGYFTVMYNIKILWLLVRKRTIPTERSPHVGEVSANFCG
jgi:4-hydroxybenzoate polyprenyltransferase